MNGKICLLPMIVLSFGCAFPTDEILADGAVACLTTDFIDKEIFMDVDRLRNVRLLESMATKRRPSNILPEFDADLFPQRSYSLFLPYNLQQRTGQLKPETFTVSHTGSNTMKRAFDSIAYLRRFGGFRK
ncbi:hypothetical protein DPMN_157685 [Dreissena polymorpha]|uniref:Uncharacterized protein n=1 Tax=Dreissena polymorpha TaxID=45954 RepID=A0A9D4EGG3_DREPO|nr:hypothetical protein DPMN_157685 [Dreissena polymorpha]